MENRKKILAILATTIIMLSFLVIAFEIQATYAENITGDYALVNGVLATDKYSLYPFAKKSLNIGFSKYGEMIDDRNNVGLEYGAVDPFAAPAGSSVGSIPKVLWIQGWLINISYYNIPQSKNRNVWAYAAFSDANAYGGSWIRVDFANDYSATYGREDPRDPGYIIGNYGAGATNFGGRKTNGTAVTQPIQVLYNGPRLFVALLNTTIYDHPVYLSDSTANDIPLVRVVFTIMFNKVKKEVVILKDVKSLLTEKTGVHMNIQFSNRGEVDLGTEAAGYHSNFHFFTQGTALEDSLVEGQPTVYNRAWTACPTVDLGADSAFGNMSQISAATYDVAQAINTGAGYVWWAAFWPSLSDWTIDGWGIHFRSMTAADPHWVDGDPARGGEPRIPFYIGEWDFQLYAKEYAANNPIEFRGVTVYGVTDLNDGNDASCIIDKEVKYQLDEIFNPWDLAQAVHKDTQRWVEFYTVTADDVFYATNYGWPLNIILDHKPVLKAPVWEEYNSFSERVMWGGALKIPQRAIPTPYDYELNTLPDGTGYITIPANKVPAAGTVIKILYSTATEYGYPDGMTFANVTLSDIEAKQGYILNDHEWLSIYSMTDWLDASHKVEVAGNITIREINVDEQENHTWTYTNSINPYAYDVKVFKEEEATLLGIDDLNLPPENVTDNGNVVEVSIHDIWGEWDVKGPEGLDLHIDYLDVVITWTVTIHYNATSGNYTVNVVVTAEPWELNEYLYLEHIPGRYEWGVVGRDANTVDSAGLSMVSAAFKNKQVEYGLAGADIYDPLPYNQMPYVMHRFGTGNTKADYYYSGTDYRTALRDDWCRAGTLAGDEVPVASSNMIGAGGPLANLLAYYGNDFAQAIYGLNQFTDYSAWEEHIIPLTCWDITKTRTYNSTNTTGYAVISTYQDINGTVLFLVWGHWGRDTYYASKWFHEEGIYQLQDAPEGLTAIILKITFESTSEGYKPKAYTIVECLGTISETKWTHGSVIKGGIHDP